MKESPPFWSFTGKKHYMRLDDFPGPGSYSPADIGRYTAPKYRLGTAKRPPLYSEPETPGPGSYSPGLSATTPFWSLSGKTGRDGICTRDDDYRPYRTNIYPSPRNSQMQSRKRTASAAENYRESSLNSSPKRGSNLPSTPKSLIKNHVPGPGVYEIKPIQEGPCFTFSQKFEMKVKCPVPGPGEYKLSEKLVQEKKPAWVVGKELKNLKLGFKDQIENPGPGSYEKVTTLGGPQWSFGIDKRKSSRFTNVPGPGSYRTQNVFGNPPSYVNLNK